VDSIILIDGEKNTCFIWIRFDDRIINYSSAIFQTYNLLPAAIDGINTKIVAFHYCQSKCNPL
jgi:hypothetical protein